MSKKIGIRTKCKGTFLSATVVNTCVFLFEEPCTRPIDRKISECFRSFFGNFRNVSDSFNVSGKIRIPTNLCMKKYSTLADSVQVNVTLTYVNFLL